MESTLLGSIKKTTSKDIKYLVVGSVQAHGVVHIFKKNPESVNMQCSETAVTGLSESVLSRNLHIYSNVPFGSSNMSCAVDLTEYEGTLFCSSGSRIDKLIDQITIIKKEINDYMRDEKDKRASNEEERSAKIRKIDEKEKRIAIYAKIQAIIRNIISQLFSQFNQRYIKQPLITELYEFSKDKSYADDFELKDIKKTKDMAWLQWVRASPRRVEKHDTFSGIFITFIRLDVDDDLHQVGFCDITKMSQIMEIFGSLKTVNDYNLINVIYKYIDLWNRYVNIVVQIEKSIGPIIQNFNKIELTEDRQKIIRINNESVYHIINIILNFKDYDINNNGIIDALTSFSLDYNDEVFYLEFQKLLNFLCHRFNVDLHLINNACRCTVDGTIPENIDEELRRIRLAELENAVAGHLQESQSQGGKKRSYKRKNKKSKNKRKSRNKKRRKSI